PFRLVGPITVWILIVLFTLVEWQIPNVAFQFLIDDQLYPHGDFQFKVQLLIAHEIMVDDVEMTVKYQLLVLLLHMIADVTGTRCRSLIGGPMCRIFIVDGRPFHGVYFDDMHVHPALAFKNLAVADGGTALNAGWPIERIAT